MTRRTLLIVAISAASVFAGGYKLLDTARPARPVSSLGGAPTKVVAVPGSALVPVGDGSNDWMLIGPDGAVLAGPDGQPPEPTPVRGSHTE